MENTIKNSWNSENPDSLYKPVFLRLNKSEDRAHFNQLQSSRQVHFCHDHIFGQLTELIKCRNPADKILDYEPLIGKHVDGIPLKEYGVWVYYPWNKTLLHLLDEEEFIELRTNRNREKITTEEQRLLRGKIIGIVGLSVGQSIALTLAMERTCGELRLADFDSAELSNLNRLRTGLQNLGLKKTIIAAREIAEIDPFLKVEIYSEGLNRNNFDSFFGGNGQMDLLVEVCDSLEIKIESRFIAREMKIPVVMDTNDRGMLDVERFDLEPDRSIFHGLIDGFLEGKTIPEQTNRYELLKALVAYDSLSEKMKLSMENISKTITTWPQLASSVVLGGAITTDICRRILLNQHNSSGRYYVDLEHLI